MVSRMDFVVDNIKEAKRRLIVNIISNILNILIGGVVGIWMVPYLKNHLGLAAYGMIPLISSITNYFNVFTLSITHTVSRFSIIHLSRKELNTSNIYFNTALMTLIGISLILLPLVIVMSFYIDSIFNVPVGWEKDTGLMFILIAIATFSNSTLSPYLVGIVANYRYDVIYLSNACAKILQVVCLVTLFNIVSKSLTAFGISSLIMAFFVFAVSFSISKRLSPDIHFRWNYFRISALMEMLKMGVWVIVNELGGLLFFSVNLILLNLYMGTENTSRYSMILQWVMMLDLIVRGISNVLSPISYNYVAHNQLDELCRQIVRSQKYLAFLIALSMALLCGFSRPLLYHWLGEDFTGLSGLMWVMISGCFVSLLSHPLYAVNRALNQVRIPAVVTICFGLMNIILGIILLKYTSLGLYSVAYSTLFSLVCKNLLFDTLYSSHILKSSWWVFLKGPFFVLALFIPSSLLFQLTNYIVDLHSFPKFILMILASVTIYSSICFFAVMKKSDREFIFSLLHINSIFVRDDKGE